AAGIVRPREAVALAGVLLLLAFGLAVQLHRLALVLSLFAVAITVLYPFLKRFFAFPQAGLGIAFSFGIPMAFAAQMGTVPTLGWALMGATFFWIVAYDTEYAMVDRGDDVRVGVHSSAIVLGRYDVAAVMACQAAFLAALAAIGAWQGMGAIYHASLLVAAAFVLVQYRLIRERERESCFRAFLTNNWMGAVVFAGIALDLLFRIHIFN
ncbi:MAG TPA: 4-hydroxybenzoate octaprenyltransferase, partial [Burkholderiales bacterium]|nr:4-hydroxybenzoate octaprenyltransferase [Burkholderiales bacterium]